MSGDIEACDGRRVAQAALGWLGTPYRHRASACGAGCDCLGLLRGVWRELNGCEPTTLPTYRADWRDPENASALLWAAERFLLPGEALAVTGDVVLFQLHRSMPPKHCGIMIAPDCFVHAQEELGVVEAFLTSAWARRAARFYRIPNLSES